MTTITRLAALGAALAVTACGHAWGPGGGPGPGPGAMAGGGPGAMGMGPGMMGMGPGMMGPGMMGGAGGYGGPGAWGMGPGMMGGPGDAGWGLAQLDLSEDQKTRIAAIQDDVGRRQWALMNAMHAQGGPMHGGGWDEQGQRRSYEAMSALHKQMFELHLEARRRVMEVLTPAQRERLDAGRGPGGRR